MDLTRMDPESPVLWLRVDVDMSCLRHVCLLQADYMWQYMLRYERDAVGQFESVDPLVDYLRRRQETTQETRMALTEVVEDERLYYRVRTKACNALCLVSNTPLLDSTFRATFGSPSCRQLVRQNDFSNFQQYFLQKAIPQALATVKNQAHMCPPEVSGTLSAVAFELKQKASIFPADRSLPARPSQVQRQQSKPVLRLLLPRVSGQCIALHPHHSALWPQLGGLAEFSARRSPRRGRGGRAPAEHGEADAELPLRGHVRVFSHAAQAAGKFRQSAGFPELPTRPSFPQKLGYIPVDASIFREYAGDGCSYDVRLAGLNALVDLVRNERDEQVRQTSARSCSC